MLARAYRHSRRRKTRSLHGRNARPNEPKRRETERTQQARDRTNPRGCSPRRVAPARSPVLRRGTRSRRSHAAVTQLTKSRRTPSSCAAHNARAAPGRRAGRTKEPASDEGPRRGQAGGRLQRQDPRQGRRHRRRDRQRQDVDEPVRRDRHRRGDPAARKPARPSEVIAVSLGEAKCQETLRTALAMGADRAIHVQTDAELQPLAVAKLLKAVVEARAAGARHPRQAGDRRRQQPDRPDAGGAAGLAAGHLRLQARVRGRRAARSRARSTAGSRRSTLKLPAVVTRDLRLNEPRYARCPTS